MKLKSYFWIFKMFLCRTEGRSHFASGGSGGVLRAGFLWDKPEQRGSGSDEGHGGQRDTAGPASGRADPRHTHEPKGHRS